MTDRILRTYIRAASVLLADGAGNMDWERFLPLDPQILHGIREEIGAARWDETVDDETVCGLVLRAVQHSGRLVNRQVRESFVRNCPRRMREYAAVFRAVYGDAPDEPAFRRAAAVLGANYDLIAFLFSVRPSPFTAEDGETMPFLPLRPARTEASLALLGYPLRLSKQCSWDNYAQYMLAVRQIRDVMRETVGDKTGRPITTVDAFAFLWMTETLRQKIEEAELIESLRMQLALTAAQPAGQDLPDDGGPRPKPVLPENAILPPRDVHAAKTALLHACGHCAADVRHKTFVRKNTGEPFAEPHHLIPLCFSDAFDHALDHPANIVPLCSQCHAMLHYGRDAALLLTKLYDKRADALEEAGIGISCAELLRMYGIPSFA